MLFSFVHEAKKYIIQFLRDYDPYLEDNEKIILNIIIIGLCENKNMANKLSNNQISDVNFKQALIVTKWFFTNANTALQKYENFLQFAYGLDALQTKLITQELGLYADRKEHLESFAFVAPKISF